MTEAKSLMRSTGSNCENQISGLSEGFQDLPDYPSGRCFSPADGRLR